MRKGKAPIPIILTGDDRLTLQQWARRPTTAQALALRSRIVLACADRPEHSNGLIARNLAVSINTVGKWRKRFAEGGPDALSDAPRAGAPRSISDDEVDRLVAMTLESTPKGATHWSTRSMARASGMSQTAVSRIWRAFGLRPHVAETFKLSTDPLFVDKVRDVVGLYMSPPANAMVLCVDEKPQIQATGRTAPVLPMTPGVAERRTHDYERNGTTDLFAALDVHSGRVIGECRSRHRSVDFCAFLDTVEAQVPAGLDVHLVLGQREHAQGAAGQGLAAGAPALRAALHADLVVVAEPGRVLVFDFDAASASARRASERGFAARGHRGLRVGDEREPAPVCVDEDGGRDLVERGPVLPTHL